MHSIELARIAALIAAQGPALIQIQPTVPAEALVRYWTAAKERFELWNQGLDRFHTLELHGRSLAMRDWWQEHLRLIEEILISESLTRVMAAIGAGWDGDGVMGEVEPITQATFVNHMEARNRVLRLLLFGSGSVQEMLRLNRLRRSAERWTDYLLAPMSRQHPQTLRFAHDGGRTCGFADESLRLATAGDAAAPGGWTDVTLAISLAALSSRQPALPHANQQIGQAALACLGPQFFDSHGLLLSARTQRLQANHSPECRPGNGKQRSHRLLDPMHEQPRSPHLVRWTL